MHIGQDLTEEILRSHLAKYSCHVELATALHSFEQFDDHVDVEIIKTTSEETGKPQRRHEVPEKLSVKFLIGADGAHSTSTIQLH